jgi:CheY-like chemotaxis protein
MNEVGPQQIAAYRSELAQLKSQILAQLGHWRALPKAIAHALDYSNRATKSGNISGVERSVAFEIQKVLGPYATYEEEIPLSEAMRLRGEALELLKLSKKLPGSEKPGSLWNELHSTVQQHMESAARGFDDIQSKLSQLISDIPSEESNRSKDYLSETLEKFRSTKPDLSSVSRLMEGIENGIAALPNVKSELEIRRAIPLHTKRFLLAIIEDNKEWQEFVLRSVDRVKQQLGNSFSIETKLFSNVQDALAELVDGNREMSSEEEDDTVSPLQVVAIADMGLPADHEEAESIQRGETTPSRSNGHELLRRLRTYRTNIPVVVLTTPAYLLEDQILACAQGIEDYHYILKGPDKEERLVEALLRVIYLSQNHRIDLFLFPKYETRVDGIPIPLTDMPFRTLYALSLLSSHSRKAGYTPESILDQLDETFRDDYDYKRPPATPVERSLVLARQRSGSWWSPSHATRIANVIRLWAARKAECGGYPDVAIERLRKENFQVWKDGLSLVDSFRKANPDRPVWNDRSTLSTQHFDSRAVASSFEECFGGLEIDERPDYDLHNIEEHINLIRDGVHSAFQQAHRFIEPRTEILVRRMAGDEYGYRVLGELVLHDEPSQGEDDNGSTYDHESVGSPERRDPIRVLVVENEQQYLSRIELLLKSAGFNVRVATNEEDAIIEARIFQPEILSLDLHIPATRKEFESEPTVGSAEGGLRVLRFIREDLPHIRVVIPTTLFDQDELREIAAELDVSATDFVSKGESINGATWEGHMLLTVSRFRQELLSHAVLPALPPWSYPLIRILDGSDLATGRLNLDVNGRGFRLKQSNQGRLLSLLLKSRGDAVSYTEIDQYVEGRPGKVGVNTRKQWIKNIRERIRSDWLGLSDDVPERPELKILETVDEGLVLHAHVEGLGSTYMDEQ